MLRKRSWFGLAGLTAGGVTAGMMTIAGNYPALVDRLYSRGIYPVLNRILSVVPGLLPFSLIEFLAALGLALLVFLVGRKLLRLWRGRHAAPRSPRPSWWRRWLPNVLLALSLPAWLFAWYGLGWGLNHYRPAWATIQNWEMRDLPDATVTAFLDDLIDASTRERSLLRPGPAGEALPPRSSWADPAFFQKVSLDYQRISASYAGLAGDWTPAKSAWASPLLTSLGVSGIYLPFFGEPLVNIQPGNWAIPFIAAHESAHARGWAREDEANFLAFLALESSPEPAFRYSAHLMALDAVYAAMLQAGGKLAVAARAGAARCDPGVKVDIQANYRWWQDRRSPLMDFQRGVNDAYLKAQGHQDGVKSYGRMVELMVAWYARSH